MKLFEYQAKEVFRANNIPTPNSQLMIDMAELPDALESIGVPCALKSQVLRGGRGKAGLIPLVKTMEENPEFKMTSNHLVCILLKSF